MRKKSKKEVLAILERAERQADATIERIENLAAVVGGLDGYIHLEQAILNLPWICGQEVDSYAPGWEKRFFEKAVIAAHSGRLPMKTDFGLPAVRLRDFLKWAAWVWKPSPLTMVFWYLRSEPKPSHSPDFRFLVWNGTEFKLTKKQAKVVQLLWEAGEAGFPGVSLEALNESLKRPQGADLRDLFRVQHRNWRALLDSDGNGIWRLTPSK